MAHLLTRIRDRHQPLGDEAGIGMLTALMVVFVVFVVAGMWVTTSVHQTTSSGGERDREIAFAAAEAGINHAMSRLATSATDCSPIGPVDIGGAQYEVEFDELIECNDADETRRHFTARGYVPAKDHHRPQQRQLEQQVELVALSGFRYALFSAPGGITGNNNIDVIGDVYSTDDLDLSNHSKVKGDVVGLKNVIMANNTTITGMVHAGLDARINHPGGTVEGNVLAGGDIVTQGTIKGYAQAGGTVTKVGNAVIDGDATSHSKPPDPVAQTLPTFDPTALSYDGGTFATAGDLHAYWNARTNGFGGTYRLPGAAVGHLNLDSPWTMSGDAVIVSDGRLTMSRRATNGTTGDVTLALISLAEGEDAIVLSHNQALTRDIKVLLYAPNGCVRFANLKDFSGTVYAKCIRLDNNFTLTFHPVELGGFSWDVTSSNQFRIESRVFREVPFSPL